MYAFADCSSGKLMFSPTVRPPASAAPRLAASMIPCPPPEQTRKRGASGGRAFDQAVNKRASVRASS